MSKVVIFFVVRMLKKLRWVYWHIIYMDYKKQYDVCDSFGFNGAQILIYGLGDIALGENSYIGDGSTIQSVYGAKVIIEEGCQISHNVRIYTQSVDADADFCCYPIPTKTSNVTVRAYSWIGANVFINPGVTIGRNSVVGANSVVTKDIPDCEIWGGVPAKFIRKKKAFNGLV